MPMGDPQPCTVCQGYHPGYCYQQMALMFEHQADQTATIQRWEAETRTAITRYKDLIEKVDLTFHDQERYELAVWVLEQLLDRCTSPTTPPPI